MKDSPTPPPAPDPAATAGAQSQSNIATAIANAQLNRVNQQTPWGNITYTQGAPGANGVPTWSSEVNLSPQQQAILDQQQQMQMQRGAMGQQFLSQVPMGALNLSSLPGINNRGHMYNGPPPVQQQAQQPQGQPQQPQAPHPSEAAIQQAIAAAIAHQNQGQGQPQGQPQQPVGQPTPQPQVQQTSQGSSPINFQDYLNYQQQFVGSEAGQPLDPAALERQWNEMTPQQRNLGLGGGLTIGRNDPRYADLSAQVGGEPDRPLNIHEGVFDSRNMSQNGEGQMVQFLKDPSRAYQGDGFYAINPADQTPEAQRQGGMSDREWALLAASLFGGGMYAGGAFGGAEGAAGAAGGAGGASEAAMPFEAGYPGNAAQFANVGAGAPVTDLSVAAQQPNIFQQGWNNFTSGKGILGLKPGYSSAASILPNLLRRKPGGSQ